MWLVQARKPDMPNNYFKLNQKAGLLRATGVKIILSFIIGCALSTNAVRTSALSALIILYAGFVSSLVIDFIKTARKPHGF
jgi:hypothetical protein